MGSTTKQESCRRLDRLRRRSRPARTRRVLLGVVIAAFMSISAVGEAGQAQPPTADGALGRQADASATASPPTSTASSSGVQIAAAPTQPVTATTGHTPPAPPSGWAPAQEASVSIPRLGMSLPVHMGGQEVIDQGVATHYSGPVSRPPVSVGEAGTYWLAGHQSTHGKPFARLPESAVGDQVVVTNRQGVSFTYAVTSTEIVGTKAPRAALYGTDPSARRILLQTCLGSTRRLLVHGTLTGVS